MGLVGFAIKALVILAIVIVVIAYGWPYIEPHLSSIRNMAGSGVDITKTGMSILVNST